MLENEDVDIGVRTRIYLTDGRHDWRTHCVSLFVHREDSVGDQKGSNSEEEDLNK